MTALIVLVYYDRPNMVKNALRSVRDQRSDNWHLAFIDDGSATLGQPIVREVMGTELYDPRTTCYRCEDSVDEKREQNGSRHGAFMNRAILECPGDVVIVLCDDDALMPTAVGDITKWYQDNPTEMYSWSRVRTFDPFVVLPSMEVPLTPDGPNRFGTDRISPACHVDSSQVTYRASAVREAGLRYPSPITCALDAAMFTALEERYGLCPATGLEIQFKGVFPDQMGRRPVERVFDPHDLP